MISCILKEKRARDIRRDGDTESRIVSAKSDRGRSQR